MTSDDRWVQFWERIRAPLQALALPVFLAFVAGLFALAAGEREAEVRTLEMAISLLQESPNESRETNDLRLWAINVVDEYSGVPLPPGARRALETRAFDLSRSSRDKAIGDLQRALAIKREENREISITQIASAATGQGGSLRSEIIEEVIEKASLHPRIAEFLRASTSPNDLADRLRDLDPVTVTRIGIHTDF